MRKNGCDVFEETIHRWRNWNNFKFHSETNYGIFFVSTGAILKIYIHKNAFCEEEEHLRLSVTTQRGEWVFFRDA